jgi:PAS domain S-box-containing protein
MVTTAHSPTEMAVLLKEKEFAEKAVDLALNAVITSDLEGTILTWNSAAEKIFGYTKIEMLGENISKILSEKYYKVNEGGLLRLKETRVLNESAHCYELEGLRKDGSLFPIELRTSLWKVDDSWYCGAVIHDITEQREITEKLKQSEERYRLLVNDVKDYAIFMLDPQGRVVTWNKGAEKINGYREDEIIGKHFSIFYTPSDLDRHWPEEELKRAREQGRFEDEGLRVRKDGTFYHSNVVITSLWNKRDELVGYSKVTRDISEKKKLEEQRDRFFTVNLDLLMISDLKGNIRRINPAWEEILGYPVKDLIGTPFLKYVHPEDMRNTDEQFSRLTRGERITDFENRYVCKEKSIKWLSWTAVPFLGDGLIYSVARDITSQKEALAKLEQTQKDLERSNQDLQQFAYVASHDLQEPLRMVISFLGLLQKKYQGNLDAKADQYINYAADGATRMKALINDLLSFSRIGTKGKLSEVVDMNDVYAQVIQTLGPRLQETKAEITCDPLPTIQGDQYQMIQLLQNFFTNAVKFRREKEIPRVHLGVIQEEKQWKFFIRDNGIGIEEKYQPKLFNLFTRLHTRDKYEGTGIGLAICKKIVERHGGRIWVESKVGVGSTFYFTIPILPRTEDEYAGI